MDTKLKAPFPYFGGKSKIAHKVWNALGNVKHYIEPFFGSGAVLLLRPNYTQDMVETINDKDAHIANVWRSLQFNPDEVAKWCDWPVNHADLCARKKEIIKSENYLLENLITNPEWCDPKLAGYWIWSASCWIGSGLTRPNAINAIPDISEGGKGAHAIGQRPHISVGGQGVHTYNNNIYNWFKTISHRLRRVRVVCGDWTRVCGGNWQDSMGTCGMFFDPPYGVEDRDLSLYHHEGSDIAEGVKEWCRERGNNKNYRIVIAGYEEYLDLVDHGWRVEEWKANGGYSNIGKGNNNCHREKLYYSPHCVVGQRKLF